MGFLYFWGVFYQALMRKELMIAINGAGSKLFNTDENGLYYKIFGKDNAEIKS